MRNLRSIASLRLDFGTATGQGRAWTYLLGENGTGKSSVLRAIALALAGSDAALELVGSPDDWIRLGESEASIEIEFATARGAPRQAGLVLRRGMGVAEFGATNRAALKQIDAAIAKSERNYFVVGYGVARRPGAGPAWATVAQGRSRSPRSRATATLFNPDVPLVPLEQWAMDLDYRQGEAGMGAVRSALDKLLPDVRFRGIDREGRRLIFATPDGDLPLSALSDGYQAMAAWCGDLLWQITENFQDYSNPLAARGLLLVDEIDLHLHPVWQRRLVDFIKQTLPNVQVVVTTHSPLTIHQAGAGELFVLRRDALAGATLQAYDGAPNRLMLHQLLQSPIFGLETLDSPQVEAARDELRDLQRIGRSEGAPSKAERARIRTLQKELGDVPSWRASQPYLARTNAALERIAEVMGAAGEAPRRAAKTRKA
ncbi:AAA family ATPase [Falsiroseomonas sp.]|uniref:AAA family ATPase n=1 Tax=Falsiroseomonas sp. TaxID=2870721 RepID=UPI003F72A13B